MRELPKLWDVVQSHRIVSVGLLIKMQRTLNNLQTLSPELKNILNTVDALLKVSTAAREALNKRHPPVTKEFLDKVYATHTQFYDDLYKFHIDTGSHASPAEFYLMFSHRYPM